MLTTDSQPIYSNVGYRPASGVRTSAPANASTVSSPIRTVSTRPTRNTTTVSSSGSSGGLLNSASAIADAYSTVSKIGNFFTTPASEIGLSTGPISGAVNAFGANYLGLSPGVTGSTAVYGPLPAGTTGFVGPPAAAGPTLVGSLGAASLGAIGGGYLADLTGGNPLGGSIGGAIGAGAGYAGALSALGLAGGPIGALALGVAGGLLGGAFGNSSKPNPAAGLLKAPISADGSLSGGRFAGKHIGGDIPSSLQQEFSSVLKNVKNTTGVDLGDNYLVDFYYDPGLHGSGNSTRITVYERDPQVYEQAIKEEYKKEYDKFYNRNSGVAFSRTPDGGVRLDNTGNSIRPPDNALEVLTKEAAPFVDVAKKVIEDTVAKHGAIMYDAHDQLNANINLAIANNPELSSKLRATQNLQYYPGQGVYDGVGDFLRYLATGEPHVNVKTEILKANPLDYTHPYSAAGRAAEKADKVVVSNIFFDPSNSDSRAKAYEQALQQLYGSQLTNVKQQQQQAQPSQFTGLTQQQSNIVIQRPQRQQTTISSQSGETPFQKFRREFVENRNARTSRASA